MSRQYDFPIMLLVVVLLCSIGYSYKLGHDKGVMDGVCSSMHIVALLHGDKDAGHASGMCSQAQWDYLQVPKMLAGRGQSGD